MQNWIDNAKPIKYGSKNGITYRLSSKYILHGTSCRSELSSVYYAVFHKTFKLVTVHEGRNRIPENLKIEVLGSQNKVFPHIGTRILEIPSKIP